MCFGMVDDWPVWIECLRIPVSYEWAKQRVSGVHTMIQQAYGWRVKAWEGHPLYQILHKLLLINGVEAKELRG